MMGDSIDYTIKERKGIIPLPLFKFLTIQL